MGANAATANWAEIGKKQTARTRATARANTKLRQAHPDEWKKLYDECVEEVMKELDEAKSKS